MSVSRVGVLAATVCAVFVALPANVGSPGRQAPSAAPKPGAPAWLSRATGSGHLQPGSKPGVLPGPVLIADEANNRLVIVDPQGRILWRFPRRGDLPRGQSFLVPDDAFFAPDGRRIIATEEDDFVVSILDAAAHRMAWRYGTPGVPGSAPNQLWNPDDAMLLRDGRVLVADIKNCRILLIAPRAGRIVRQFGQVGACVHDPPRTFASPNGVFPMRNGHYLVTEINGDWIDEIGLNGTVYRSIHAPGVRYPSDTNEISPGRYLTADYSSAGQVVIFDAHGRTLWRFAATGSRALNHPSLALPLPNGDILITDDWNDRVIVVDPRTNRIVWQYGHTGVPGIAPGYLHIPDGADLAPPYDLASRTP
jgi:hypothetical protein